MTRPISRRTFGLMSGGAFAIGGTRFPVTARTQDATPDATPELDRYSTLLERLDAVDPQTTLDLLMTAPFELGTIVPLAEFAGIGPITLELDDDNPFADEALGGVQLATPDGDPGIGAFIVYPDEISATTAIESAVSEETSDDISFEPIDRLAGLESTMIVIGDQRANVATIARYVVILASDDILADGALTNSFNAQLRALQHALGLIKHLDVVLAQSNMG